MRWIVLFSFVGVLLILSSCGPQDDLADVGDAPTPMAPSKPKIKESNHEPQLHDSEDDQHIEDRHKPATRQQGDHPARHNSDSRQSPSQRSTNGHDDRDGTKKRHNIDQPHTDHGDAHHQNKKHANDAGDTDVKHQDSHHKSNHDTPSEKPIDLAFKEDAELKDLSATQIFERRILPILRSQKASSCTECHFGGVEIRNYIREDQATTFAALRAQHLINLKSPEKSRLLTFIARRPDNEDKLIAKVRRSEYQTFRAWISAAARDPKLLAAKSSNTKVGTELPMEVVRHMRRDRVLRSFVENIWSEMGRCVNCHSPNRNKRLISEYGEQISWIVPGDPAATLQELVDGGNIDIEKPDESLVLFKPVGLEDHGGGPKFAAGSRTDKNFRRFLTDYAAVVKGKIQRTDQIPKPSKDVARLTHQQLRIVNLPNSLDKKLLKADIYRWTDSGWSKTPWGTAENAINGKKNMWQNMVFAVAPRDSKRAAEIGRMKDALLPGGRYLVKIYVDKQEKTKGNRDYELGESEFLGQVEFTGPWKAGYQPPKIIQAPAQN